MPRTLTGPNLARHARCEVIVGQEETVGESSVSVVAGVRTVTTNLEWARRNSTFCRAFPLFRYQGSTKFQATSASPSNLLAVLESSFIEITNSTKQQFSPGPRY